MNSQNVRAVTSFQPIVSVVLKFGILIDFQFSPEPRIKLPDVLWHAGNIPT